MTIWIWIIWTWSISIWVHAPIVMQSKEAKITAVLSRSTERGKEFLNDFQIDNWAVYDKLDDFLSDANIDAIIICSPDKLHFEQASKSLLAWKHVLLEKPMTTIEKPWKTFKNHQNQWKNHWKTFGNHRKLANTHWRKPLK